MRRSPLLTVQVLCPHFQRPVHAQRNQATDTLVDCESKDECATSVTTDAGAAIVVYPRGCPVFRTLQPRG
jgi:hypothetical protein